VLRAWVEEHDDLVECPQPAGGVTAFPRIKHEVDTTRLCQVLANRHGVLVVPGSCFGHPDRVRIGFGGSGGNLGIGLAALASLLTGEPR
jgi:aspartate/methionine/tyrosine aminotransferase